MKAAIIAALLLVGCVHTGFNAVPGPDGDIVYEAYCNGGHATFADCMKVAANVCKGPYKIIDKDSQSGFVDTGDLIINKQSKQMLFRCKETKGEERPIPTRKASAGDQCAWEEDCGALLRCREQHCVEP